jgi:nitroreductase
MDALEAITQRRVQRAFDRRPVESEALRKIVDAGRHAMSARNLQPWGFIVVESRERLKEIGALCSTGKFVADGPAAVVVLKKSPTHAGRTSTAAKRCRTWPTRRGRSG